jgi:GTP cyclohydrolase I
MKKIQKKKPKPAPYYLEHTQDAATTHFPSPIVKEIVEEKPDADKIALIADRFKDIMEILGLDISDPSLARTPHRVATMFVKEVFSGLDTRNFPSISFVKDQFHHKHHAHIVFLKVGFTSFCEHHFVPMTGTAYVAYKPKNKLIGLSKIPRMVRYFSRRPQLQERLTAQIADSLAILMDSSDVAVSISAVHFCVIARGVEDQCSNTITNVLRGEFDTNEGLRREFFEAINRSTN